MALIVQKYGGSSVADAEKIKNVARRVAEQAPCNQLVVVVSAMGKTTDGLISLPASKALGLTMPQSMVARADEVIE
jgi:aspartate kinase